MDNGATGYLDDPGASISPAAFLSSLGAAEREQALASSSRWDLPESDTDAEVRGKYRSKRSNRHHGDRTKKKRSHKTRRGELHVSDVDSEPELAATTATELRQARANLAQRHQSRVQRGYGYEYSDQDDDDVESWDSEEEARLAQEQWDDSLRQLQLAVQVMVLPALGKMFGRKWSYWLFARYQAHGRIDAHFFGLHWLWSSMSTIPSAAAVLEV